MNGKVIFSFFEIENHKEIGLDFLNEYGRQGWKVQTMEKELRRLFLFWKRESYILVLSKD